jgi:hypothetical protein
MSATSGQKPLDNNRSHIGLDDPDTIALAREKSDAPHYHPLIQSLLESIPGKRIYGCKVAEHLG